MQKKVIVTKEIKLLSGSLALIGILIDRQVDKQIE